MEHISVYARRYFLVYAYISESRYKKLASVAASGDGDQEAGDAEEGRLTLQFIPFGIFYFLYHGLQLPVQTLNKIK